MNSFIAEIDRAFREGGERPAFVQGDRRLTCREAERQISTFEQWIRDHCQPGDRVAALTRNRIEAVLLEWATYRAGCIWLGIPARERDYQSLARLLADFTPRLLVLERFGPYGEIAFSEGSFPARETNLPPGLDPTRFRVLLRSDREGRVSFSIGEERIRRLRYTSGSTGEPKAIAYSDRTLSTMLSMISETVLEGREWTIVHGLPITWASGSLIAPALCHGGKNVVLESWDSERFTRAVALEERVLCLLTPGLLAALTRYSEINGIGWAQGLMRVLLAGGPTPVWTMSRAWKLFPRGTEFFVTLGQTEASFPITWHRVVEEDVRVGDSNSWPLVPLGEFTKHYQGSRLGRVWGEILVKGKAVAPGHWLAAEGNFQALQQPHHTGDRARKTAGILHYLGRMSDPWRDDPSLPAAEAVEAVLNDCPGVQRSRVDLLLNHVDADGGITADVTVQPIAGSLQVDRVQEFFEENKTEARLASVSLRRVSIGGVELTMSAKVLRHKMPGVGAPPAPAVSGGESGSTNSNGGTGSLSAGRWEEFDFSRIASGPLYFYVGAGLSMGAGLAGWSEMAYLIWLYRKNFEKEVKKLPCPLNTAEKIEEFLDLFVSEKIDETDSSSAPILSRQAGDDSRTLGRTALLNMLLRYRGPRVHLKPENGQAVADSQKLRLRPGEEPSQEDLMVQSLIWRSRCHGVFTTNYDVLLEHAFSLYHHGASLRSYRYTANFLRFILSNPRFILKLHGDINDIATMEFSLRKAWSEGGLSGERGADLKKAYKAALDRGHMIYLGCGFRDETIRRLHRGWSQKNESRFLTRIALLPEWELENPATRAEIEETPTHEIELLSFSAFPEVRDFMEKVVSVRSGARKHWASCPEAADLHQQLFLAWDPTEAKRHFSTKPWSCEGKALSEVETAGQDKLSPP